MEGVHLTGEDKQHLVHVASQERVNLDGLPCTHTRESGPRQDTRGYLHVLAKSSLGCTLSLSISPM
jgi:hypothetical protein